MITIQCMNTIRKHPEFDAWLSGLKDGMTRIRLVRRLKKAENGNLGDVKNIEENLWEMREFFGPGWRMYYTERSGALIVMLGGGDKSTQKADIARARALLLELED